MISDGGEAGLRGGTGGSGRALSCHQPAQQEYVLNAGRGPAEAERGQGGTEASL